MIITREFFQLVVYMMVEVVLPCDEEGAREVVYLLVVLELFHPKRGMKKYFGKCVL